ncbi:MAG: hypothetical protein AB1668_03355 [Nanoarchaeota archaeon]
MIWMIGFWICGLLAFGLMLYNRKRQSRKINFYAGLFMVYSVLFFIMSIATKDPIFGAFGVPAEFEWVVGLFITGLTSWKLYFSPLKERVIDTEKRVEKIDEGVTWIKDNCKLCKK